MIVHVLQELTNLMLGIGIIFVVRQGHLQDRWAEWFDDLTISRESDGTTTLYGPIVDQAALQSILLKIERLNLTLISANRIELSANSE